MEFHGGVYLKDVLPGGSVLVKTRNSLYTLVNHGDRWMGQGGQRLLEAQEVRVNGSTFGGSMLKMEFIGIGMHLELILPVPPDGVKSIEELAKRTITTTAIEAIRVRLPEGEPIYECLAQIMFEHPSGGMGAQDAKRFVFAQAYGASEEQLIKQSGLEPKRVKEIIDLLKFLTVPFLDGVPHEESD